jgi:predicted aspartyl protease
MTHAFDPSEGLIVVSAVICGPAGDAVVRLALDTGATTTLISVDPLIGIGIDPDASSDRSPMTTGSRIEDVAIVRLDSISALGFELAQFPIIAHTLPAATGVDGLLGLDFFDGRQLHIDFQKSTVMLE